MAPADLVSGEVCVQQVTPGDEVVGGGRQADRGGESSSASVCAPQAARMRAAAWRSADRASAMASSRASFGWRGSLWSSAVNASAQWAITAVRRHSSPTTDGEASAAGRRSPVAASRCLLAAARKSPSSGLIEPSGQEPVDVRRGASGVLARRPVALPDGLGARLGQAVGQERGERGEFVGDLAGADGGAHRDRGPPGGRGERRRVAQGVAALDRGAGGGDERGEEVRCEVLTGTGDQADDLERFEPRVEQAGKGCAAA